MESGTTEPTTTQEAYTFVQAINEGYDVILDALGLFTQEPAIYFVALALLGAGAGVAKKFVPMKRR